MRYRNPVLPSFPDADLLHVCALAVCGNLGVDTGLVRQALGVRMRYIAVVVAVLTVGCIGNPTQPLPSRLTSFTGVDELKLCEDYNRSRSPAVLAELHRREALSALDDQALATKEPVIGMSMTGAWCLYGPPEKMNDTTMASVRHEQWVYCQDFMRSARHRIGLLGGAWSQEEHDAMCGESAYLYFENGRLTAHQNAVAALY